AGKLKTMTVTREVSIRVGGKEVATLPFRAEGKRVRGRAHVEIGFREHAVTERGNDRVRRNPIAVGPVPLVTQPPPCEVDFRGGWIEQLHRIGQSTARPREDFVYNYRRTISWGIIRSWRTKARRAGLPRPIITRVQAGVIIGAHEGEAHLL